MSIISLDQALRNAIESEDAANRFYTLLAESTEDAQARRFLEEMAREEATHKARIEALAKEAVDRPLTGIPDDRVELVETREEWAGAEGLDLERALAMAIEAEDFAALFYDAVASTCDDPELRKTFEALARTEERHAERLRAMRPA